MRMNAAEAKRRPGFLQGVVVVPIGCFGCALCLLQLALLQRQGEGEDRVQGVAVANFQFALDVHQLAEVLDLVR